MAVAFLALFASATARTRSDDALDQVQLAPQHRKKRLGQMSKGMKQRVKLAQCLIHRPRLVILDEPMNGLDPMGREEFSVVLRQLAKEGTSVVISSHILHDLEALCGAFLLLRWGRMPRAANTAAAAEQRQRWPRSTTFRCDAPDRLARYLFDHHLVRGCEIASESSTLHVQWADPELFYGRFHEHLLASGVQIFEVRSTTSFLEKAIESPLHA
ncbi:MAG: ATP-binding cassette domain-containing protein [Opitutaceae bacterium]